MLFSNSVLAGDVAAGLAARLEAGLNWDLVDIALRDGELVGTTAGLVQAKQLVKALDDVAAAKSKTQ